MILRPITHSIVGQSLSLIAMDGGNGIRFLTSQEGSPI